MVRLRLVAGRGAISACSSRTSQSAAAAVAMTAVTVPCLGRAASRALCSLVRPAWRAPRPRAAWSSARRTGSCQRWRIQSLDPIHCCETYVVRAWGWHSRAWGWHSCALDLHAFAPLPGVPLGRAAICTEPVKTKKTPGEPGRREPGHRHRYGARRKAVRYSTCTAPLWRRRNSVK